MFDMERLSVAGAPPVLLGTGDGSFLPRMDYTVGPDPEVVVAADLDRDGRRAHQDDAMRPLGSLAIALVLFLAPAASCPGTDCRVHFVSRHGPEGLSLAARPLVGP